MHKSQLLILLRVLLRVIRVHFLPLGVEVASALADAIAEMFLHAFRHQELGVFRPSVVALGQPDLFFAEGFAMGFAAVVLVRGAVTDVTVHDDQRRPVLGIEESLIGSVSISRSFASLTRVTFQP